MMLEMQTSWRPERWADWTASASASGAEKEKEKEREGNG